MSITLHEFKPVKAGGRNIARMSDEEFFEKIRKFVGRDEEITDEEEAADLFFEHLFDNMPNTIAKDFKGMVFSGKYKTRNYRNEIVEETAHNELHFDLENFDVELSEVDGCPYFLIETCGGDWQTPFCFMVYHDGKTFRVYVPTYGNTWIPFTKGGVKCKGLIGEYSADSGYEYGGEPDWKFLLNALDDEFNETIIDESVRHAREDADYKNPDYFLKYYGFSVSEIKEIGNFTSYAYKKAKELLKTLKKKGDVEGLNNVDNYILKQIKYSIFQTLSDYDCVEEADVDSCVSEFETRVEPFDP